MGLGLWTSEELKYHPQTGDLLTKNTWVRSRKILTRAPKGAWKCNCLPFEGNSDRQTKTDQRTDKPDDREVTLAIIINRKIDDIKLLRNR